MEATEPYIPDFASAAEQLSAGEAVENNGEEAEAEASAEAADGKYKESAEIRSKWPDWPGYCVFRIVVPVLKVGSIIGKKGDLIKKLVEETRARVRVLDGPVNFPDRIVLVTAKEEPESAMSPAMEATIRIFKRLIGLPENDGDDQTTAGAAFCSIRLLVASTQATSLIGKQGSLIMSIRESTGARIRVLSNDDLPIYASFDERLVDLQGEGFKVLKALEAVVGHLRKFLVDHSILPLFEKSYNAALTTRGRQVDTWSNKTEVRLHPFTSKTSMSSDFLPRDECQIVESHIPPSVGPVVTQIEKTLQIPLVYAEDIIGVEGANIDYIRRTSGAILTIQEGRALPDEIIVEIKGSSSQVLAALQLIQEFIGGAHSRTNLESSLRSPFSHLSGSPGYSSSYNRLDFS